MTSGLDDAEEQPFPWHLGVYDAHCHPTDTVASLRDIPDMKTSALTIMATRAQDQELVANASRDHGANDRSFTSRGSGHDVPCRVIPSFGWHPWFSHHIYDDEATTTGHATKDFSRAHHYKVVINPSPKIDSFIQGLPQPRALSDLLATTKEFLLQHPLALVGEIGLDRSFRIPESTRTGQTREPEPGLTPGSRDGRRLSPYRVDMAHQRKILKAQLALAGEMNRAVSIHGVGAHGVVFDTLQETWKGHENKVVSKRLHRKRGSFKVAHDLEKQDEPEVVAITPKPYPPRICMHSYSGPPEHLKQYFSPSIPATIFFSFSQVINFSRTGSNKAIQAIEAVPDNRILVESDLHCAGERMDGLLEQIVRSICKIKKWPLEDGVRQLAKNWMHFVLDRETGDK